MKNFKFKWLLLSFILSIASITQVEAATRRYYCKMTYDWWTTSSAAIGCYAWKSSDESQKNAEWPGVRMTSDGSGQWHIDLDTKYDRVIFTRITGSSTVTYWSAKTGNLTLGDENYYTITSSSGVWDPSTVTGSWSKYAPTPAIEGSMNSWKPDANVFSGTSGSVTCSITLSANSVYEFKVITGTSHYGYGSYTGDLTYFGQSGSTTLSTSGSNIRLATAGAGTYIFTWNCTSKTLSVAYPTVTHPSSDYVYFKNTGNWTKVKAHVFTGGTSIDNWPGMEISSFNFDGTNYYYAALGDKSSIIFSKSGDASTKTGDLTTASSNKGKYYDYSSSSWKAFTATLALNDQAATTSVAPSSVTVTYNATTNINTDVLSTTPAKTGYSFGGFYTSTAGSGTQVIGTNEKIPSDLSGYTTSGKWTKTGSSVSMTLYAKWTQSVTLNQNGATTDGTTSVSATYNGEIGSIANNPSKTNYEFQGYFPNQNGTGSCVINTSKALQTGVANWTDASTHWIHAGASTLYAKWTSSITLDKNGGSADGSVTVTYNGGAGTPSAPTYTGKVLLGYYAAADGDNLIMAKDGTLQLNKDGYTDASGNWIGAGDAKLYAHWTDHTWALYRNSGATKLGDLTPRGSDVYTINLNIVSGTNNDNWSLKLDGETMYEFPSSSPIGVARTLSTGSTYRNWSGASYGNYTLKIYYESSAWKLIANASPQISFTASPTGGSVTASAEIESTISSGAYITYNTEATFTATPSTGYTLDGWYGASDFSGEKLSTSNPLEIPSITSNTARYAKFNETMSTLSTSNSYDAGNPGYDAPTVAGSATTIGYATTRTITAAAAGTGYALSSWTITNGTRTDGGAVNASSITVRSNGDGAAVTVRANYTEVLTTNWVLKGGSEFGGTAWSTEHALTKKSGHSTESIAYWTVNMTNTTSVDNDNFNFKIVKKGVSDTYYGLPASGDEYWYLRSTGEQTMSVAKNIQLHADMTGDYEIKVDYTDEANPKITVTFPINGRYNVTLTKSGHGSVANEGTLEIHQEPKVAISATPEAGYRFTGWTVDGGHSSYISFDNASSASTNVLATSASAAGATITANFSNEGIIYLDKTNISGWTGTPYVYFYSGAYWNNDAGAGSKTSPSEGVPGTCIDGSHAMTRIGDSQIWYYDYSSLLGNKSSGSSRQYVAFTDHNQANYNWFASCQAIYRSDFYPDAPMLVMSGSYTEKKNNNTVQYYTRGLWTKYNGTDPGFVLKIFNGAGDGGTQVGYAKFAAETAGDNTFYANIDLTTGTKYFKLEGCDTTTINTVAYAGTWYSNSGTMTNLNHENWSFWNDVSNNCGITPTAAGTYKFILSLGDGVPYLTVDYPLAVNDYRVVYSGKVTTAGGAKTRVSSFIRNTSNGGTGKDTVSFFVTGDWSLTLQKCTSVATDPPTWGNACVSGHTLSAATLGLSGKTGIYMFEVAQGTGEGCDGITITNLGEYDKDFYIRTDVASGGWEAYKKSWNNIMIYSNYSKSHSGYDYYHCHYIPTDKNVKFVIANDYSACISDTVLGDAYVPAGTQKLPYQANVRFMWNSATNASSRAYLNGSSDGTSEFLKIASNPSRRTTSGTKEQNAEIVDENGDLMANNDTTFEDLGNWVYQIDLQVLEGARVKLTSDYRFNETSHLQYFKGAEGDWSNAKTTQILGGSDNSYSPLRIVYDFKTNHLLSAWLVKDNTSVTGKRAINADVMILRSGHDDAKQITFTTAASELDDVDTVYAALELKKSHILGNGSQASKEFYWVSFPYNVKINDIFGSVGNFNIDWAIQYYNGKKRAKNGYWVDSEPNWEFFESDTATLKANEGYVLTLALSRFLTTGKGSKWDNGVDSLYLYFPSAGKVGTILKTDTTLKIDTVGYTCTIDRRSQAEKAAGTNNINKNRTVADSHWHCIGIPSFANASRPTGSSWTTSEGASSVITDENDIPNIDKWTSPSLLFLYSWNMTTNKLTPVTASSYTFKAMHAYLVQYGNDTIQWKAVSTPSSIVARRRAAIQAQEFRLEISKNEVVEDQTFIRFADNEGVTAGFEFGQDLSKEFNKNSANIYTFADYVPVAGNSMPLEAEQTTVLPMGVQIAANGEYTFAMPEGTNGIGVVLIDNIAGTRTNLGLTDYTVNLNAGTYDERFVLEISPIAQIPTGIDLLNGENGANGVRKVMVDGMLYIVKDGKIFDAQGRQVK